MRSNEKARRFRRINRFDQLVATAGVFATIVALSNTQAAIPPQQALRYCIQGKELINFGLKCNDTGDCYTDYKVHFTATINGENAGEWEDTVRVKGDRSWYGYSYSSCTDMSCTKFATGGLPEEVPSQSNANAVLQKYCPEADYTAGPKVPIPPCVKAAIRSVPGDPFGLTLEQRVVNLDNVHASPRSQGESSSSDTIYVPKSSFANPDSIDFAIDLLAEIQAVEDVARLRREYPEKYRDLTPESYKKDSALDEINKKNIRQELEKNNYEDRVKECLENPALQEEDKPVG